MSAKRLSFALGLAAGIPLTYTYMKMNTINQTTTVAGGDKSLKMHTLEQGSAMIQNFAPLKSIHQHLCAFHCYCGDVNRQLRAHHFCSHLNHDLCQCVIYDSDKPDAKLIGIEYIISEKLYNSLDREEQKLWHSHKFEVKSGQLIALNVPDAVEKEALKEVISTYGKTFHTWQVDRGDKLPLGIPQLMMSFREDGQVREDLVRERDRLYNVSTQNKRQQRVDMEAPDPHPMADYWLTNKVSLQPKLVESKMK